MATLVETTMELERGEEMLECIVTGAWQAGERASWDSPGEDPHWEDITVMLRKGHDITVTLTAAEMQDAEHALDDAAERLVPDGPEYDPD